MRLYDKEGEFLGCIETPPEEILKRGQFDFETREGLMFHRYTARVHEIRIPQGRYGHFTIFVAQVVEDFRHPELVIPQGHLSEWDSEIDRLMKSRES
jgi:hypothetical protein